MESLEKKIKLFLKIDGSGLGSGSGSGDGSGRGYGDCGGYGDGRGGGYGGGYGDGSGRGYGDGIKMINNKKVYKIDNVQTTILNIKNNLAKGEILNSDFTFENCYIAKRSKSVCARKNLKRSSK